MALKLLRSINVQLPPLTAQIRLSPADFPDSRYARELRSGFRGLRFAPEIEREFVDMYLQHLRLRVGLFYLLGTLFASAFLTRALLDTNVPPIEPWLHAVAFVLHAGMLAFTLTRAFQRDYPRICSLVVPLISCLCTALSVMQVSRGRLDPLMVIPILPILIFFLAGLRFRSAVASSLLCVIVYLGTAVYLRLTTAMLYPSLGTLCGTVAICAVVAWDMEHTLRESFLEARLLRELAVLDGLTGIKNRRAFDEHLTRVWQQALRARHSFALMLIDCDHFKRYNDHCGHQAGDEALRRIARIVDSFARRPLDLAARYGGEEFALILYDVRESMARRLAEELRQAVEEARIEHDRAFVLPVMTVSIGGVLLHPLAGGYACEEAVQFADKALYTAKRSGRNCVSILSRVRSAPDMLMRSYRA